MKTRIELGKIDYNNSGRKNCLATFEVELKETEKGLVFSMCANVWNIRKTYIYCGGQCCDTIGECFPNNKKVQRLVEIWKKYHLNDLNAGTINQENALKNISGHDYTEQCKYLESVNLLYDNGYKYGTSWLFRQIPEDVIQEIKELIKE
jgi:hypothetical protein